MIIGYFLTCYPFSFWMDSISCSVSTLLSNTLLNEDVVRFLSNSDEVIFWGCNIKSPEGYRVSRTLREHTYPFVGVIGLTNLTGKFLFQK